MSERDHYEPGVPCWVDTVQPDPVAAGSFYGELLGWELFGPGRDAHRRWGLLRRAPVGPRRRRHQLAAPRGPGARAGLEHVRVGGERRRRCAAGLGRRRRGALGSVRRSAGRPDGGAERSRGRGALRLGGRRAPRRPARQRAGSLVDERAQHCLVLEQAEAFYNAVFGWHADSLISLASRSRCGGCPGMSAASRGSRCRATSSP